MYSENFAKYDAGGGLSLFISKKCAVDQHNRLLRYRRTSNGSHNLLKKTGLLEKLTPIASYKVDKEELIGFHSKEYIDKLEKFSNEDGGDVGELCQIGKGGLDVIREAVGGDFNALDAVMSGKVQNAFCLQRPPAAHAERDRGFGFCVINSFNILIQRVREKYGLKRIMIIDIDNHYKKGIEDAWYDTDEVLYAEIHQTGAVAENSAADRNADWIGSGKGTGYNVVIPMPSGAGDSAYIKAFEEVILPVAEQYKPELVVFIAGYASNIFDPLCRQQITASGYYKLTEMIKSVVDKYAQGRLIGILEGGKGNYMSFCILKTIEAMSEEKTDVPDSTAQFIVRNYVSHDQQAAIDDVKKNLAPYWKL